MDWFKRALGLKIFLGIWLLVLLVPSWRLGVSRQWTNAQLYDLYTNYDDSRDIYGFPDPDSTPAPPIKLGLTRRNQVELGRRFPEDLEAQLTALSQPNLGRVDLYTGGQKRLPELSKPYFQKFAALLQRFPNNQSIRSQWLRDATQGELLTEEDELIKSYGLAPPTKPAQAWISVAERERALQVAQDGGAADPDNAFWPWMETVFAYSLQRPDAALKALEKAGKCSHFNDGVSETTQRRIAMMKRVQTTELNDELFENFATLLPHLAKLRSVARETMWRANLALKHGDKAKALQIVGVLQKAAAPVSQAGSYFITRLVGEALCYITWRMPVTYGGVKAPPYSYKTDADREASRRMTVNLFADYMRRNGRPDLGTSAVQLQATLTGMQINKKLNDPNFDGIGQSTNSLARFHWLSSWLLTLTLWGAVAWVPSFLLSRWKFLVLPEKRKGAAISTAFCVGVTAAVLIAAMRLGIVHDYFATFGPQGEKSPYAETFKSLPNLLELLWVLPICIAVLIGQFRWPKVKLSRSHAVPILLYLSLILGAYTWVTATAVFDLHDTIWGQLWPAPIVLFWVGLLGLTGFHISKAQGSAKWTAAFFWCGLISFSLGVVSIFTKPDGNFYAGICYVLAIILLLLGVLLYLVDSRKREQWTQILLGDLVTRIRIAAATLAVMGSLAYVAVSLASLPTRQHTRAIMTEMAKIGEVAYLEK